jgi:hypothetical protein
MNLCQVPLIIFLLAAQPTSAAAFTSPAIRRPRSIFPPSRGRTSPSRLDLFSVFFASTALPSEDEHRFRLANRLERVEKEESVPAGKFPKTGEEDLDCDTALETHQSRKQKHLDTAPEEALSFRESALRSILKSLLWRLIADSVKFVTTLSLLRLHHRSHPSCRG